MEHRWGERIRFDLPVQIAVPLKSLRPARIVNLSLSGACIKADYELKALSRVDVIIAIPCNAGDQRSSITAYVTRSNSTGIGMEWCDYAPTAIVELMRSLQPPRGAALRA